MEVGRRGRRKRPGVGSRGRRERIERLALWSLVVLVCLRPRALLTVGTQLLLGRRATLPLLTAVYVKGTRFESRTEGIETLQHVKGTGQGGLALERGALRGF